MNNIEKANRISFIRDFMLQTQRPASELPMFLEAFDSCVIDAPRVLIPEKIEHKATTPTPLPESKTAEENKPAPPHKNKPDTSAKEPVVVHNNTTRNVHPKSKMVMADFEGRVEYYGSIRAAAKELHVTEAQLKYALKNKKSVNGISVITITPEEAFQMRNKKSEE